LSRRVKCTDRRIVVKSKMQAFSCGYYPQGAVINRTQRPNGSCAPCYPHKPRACLGLPPWRGIGVSMTKIKRDLSVIVDEIHIELKRDTAGIIKIGALLAEAKKQVEHGKWLPWIENNFSMSEATAQRYLKVHRFLKSRNVRDLEAAKNLSASALYDLAANRLCCWTPEAMQAIFDEAACKRVGSDRAWWIAREIFDKAEAEAKPRPEAEAENIVNFADAAEARSNDWIESTAEQEAARADDSEQEAADASAEARKQQYAKENDGPEGLEQWQHSLANLAGDAIAMPAYWTREFGDWKKFKAPSDLVTLAKQAAEAWAEVASNLECAAPKAQAA